MQKIHLVEDDPDILKGLKKGLELEGFQVQTTSDGDRVLNDVLQSQPDLMVLDIRLPGMDGLSVCRNLRRRRFLFPIIMLTARDEEVDRITGLETGADDYLVKPFSFRELVSRIRAHLRRSDGEYSSAEPGQERQKITQKIGDFNFDPESLRLVQVSTGQEVPLTPIELRLLTTFLRNRGISLSRGQLISAAWGEAVFLEDERTVDVHIRHLREKIEPDPSSPTLIQTVRGHGYRLG